MSIDKLKQYGDRAMALDVDGKVMEKVAVVSSGSLVVEQKTQSDAVTGAITFTEDIQFLEIYNVDAVNQGVFNVNGINITVPPGKVFKASYKGTPNKIVTVTGSTSYILTRYE